MRTIGFLATDPGGSLVSIYAEQPYALVTGDPQ